MALISPTSSTLRFASQRGENLPRTSARIGFTASQWIVLECRDYFAANPASSVRKRAARS